MEKKQVWIVDDEKELAKSYSDFLSDQYTPTVFHSAEDALAHFESAPEDQPDLILSDIKMPGMDGLSLVGKLRERKMTKPAVIISGYAQKADVLKASELEVASFLEKPCNPVELRRAIEKAMREEEAHSVDDQLIEKLSEQADILLSIIASGVDRYAAAENRLEETGGMTFSTNEARKAYLDKIYRESKMHRELGPLHEAIESLQSLRKELHKLG